MKRLGWNSKLVCVCRKLMNLPLDCTSTTHDIITQVTVESKIEIKDPHNKENNLAKSLVQPAASVADLSELPKNIWLSALQNVKYHTQKSTCTHQPTLSPQVTYIVLVCELVNSGSRAIIGPPNYQSSLLIGSFASSLSIPYVSIVQTPHDPEGEFTLGLYPSSRYLTNMFIQMMLKWEWKEYFLIYEKPVGKQIICDI